MSRKFEGLKDRTAFFAWLNPELPHAEKYNRERLLSSFVEVSEELADYFMEMLPPLDFAYDGFAMCEYTSYDITLAFFRHRRRYFAAQVVRSEAERDWRSKLRQDINEALFIPEDAANA